MREATTEEVSRWDKLIAANPDGGNALQSAALAATKAQFGWAPRYVMHDDIATLYLSRKLPLLGELWYAPKGPGVVTPNQFTGVTNTVKEARSAFVVEVEPELPDTPKNREMLISGGWEKIADIQVNRATVVIDLEPGEDELLTSFKQKTRYNIRLAAKRGVTVEPVEATKQNLAIMYGLIKATQARAGFFLRSEQYFRTFWAQFSKAGSGQLFFARYEGEVLAGVFVIWTGQQALYKDGGSTRQHSELQAPYLLQWEVMRWLKARGVKRYDLHGVPPEGSTPDHALASLVQFKSGFGQTTQFVGTWALPLTPAYKLWRRLGQRLVMAYWRRVRRDLFY